MIQTERLLLRRFVPEDAEALHAFLSDPEVVRYEPYPPQSMAECEAEAARRAGNPAFWAICRLEDGQMIGNIYLAQRGFEGWELGYVLARSTWGKGYATEACTAMLDHVFAQGAHRVYAQCNPDNIASWRLMERLGMRREAHMKQNVYFVANPDPQWLDTYVYAILSEEWRQRLC